MGVVIPSASDGPLSVTPMTTWPAVAPTDASLVGKVFACDGGSALHIGGVATAGTGTLQLLRHVGGTDWDPVDNDGGTDRAITINATLPTGAGAGHFGTSYLTGDALYGGGNAYVLLLTGTPTLTRVTVQSGRL